MIAETICPTGYTFRLTLTTTAVQVASLVPSGFQPKKGVKIRNMSGGNETQVGFGQAYDSAHGYAIPVGTVDDIEVADLSSMYIKTTTGTSDVCLLIR